MKKIFTISILVLSMNLSFAQWIQMPNGFGEGSYTYSMTSSGNNIFAGTSRGVYLSTNNGSDWNQIALDTMYVLSIAANGNNIYAGTDIYGVYISTNNGANWNQTSLNNYTIWSILISGNNIFAGAQQGGVFRSTNNGASWSQIGFNNNSIMTLAQNGTYLFAAHGGVYKTSNNGANWSQAGLNNKSVNSLAVIGNNIFAATDSVGVYVSTNNGDNWSQTALNNQWINTLSIVGNNLFAGTGMYPTGAGSVFLSTNFGSVWTEVNQGLNSIPMVNTLLTSGNYLFAGTYGSFVWRRDLAEMIGIKQISTLVPKAYSLQQNYPNPFNPTTKIKFEILNSKSGTNSNTEIRIYNVSGKEIAVLVNEHLNSGTYEVEWNAADYPSGVYFYKFTTDNFSKTCKMILIK